MLTRHRLWGVALRHAVLAAAVGMLSGSAGAAGAWAAAPNYHFRVVEVLGQVEDDVRAKAREVLGKELNGRDLFTSDLGGAEVSAASLRARGLRSFDVSLRFENLTKDLKEPRPGRRHKQLVVGVRISVFGSDVADQKLAFSGDGESMQIVEVDERRLDKETAALVTDVLADAIAQAVDQAVLKLSLSKTSPHAKAKKPGKAKAPAKRADGRN